MPTESEPLEPAERFHLGTGFDGEVVWDPDEAPHLQILGPTASGKTHLATGLVNQARDAGWSTICLDPKGGPLAGPMKPREACSALEDVAATTEERLNHVKGVEPRVLIVLDEAVSLMPRSPGRDTEYLTDRVRVALGTIIRVGAGVGVHLVTVSQKPPADLPPVTSITMGDAPASLLLLAAGPSGVSQRPAVQGLVTGQGAIWTHTPDNGPARMPVVFAAPGARALDAIHWEEPAVLATKRRHNQHRRQFLLGLAAHPGRWARAPQGCGFDPTRSLPGEVSTITDDRVPGMFDVVTDGRTVHVRLRQPCSLTA